MGGGRLSPHPDFARIENQRHNLLLFVPPPYPSIFGPSATPATRLIIKIFFSCAIFHNTIYRFHVTCTQNNWHFLLLFFPTSSKPQLFCHIYKFLCMSYILKKQETRINLTSAIQYFTTPLFFFSKIQT